MIIPMIQESLAILNQEVTDQSKGQKISGASFFWLQFLNKTNEKIVIISAVE